MGERGAHQPVLPSHLPALSSTYALLCVTLPAGVVCPSDKQIRHIHDLPAALPWLFEGQQPPAVPLPVTASHDAQADAAAAVAPATAEGGAAGNGVGKQPGFPAKAGSALKHGKSSSSEETIEAVYTEAVTA